MITKIHQFLTNIMIVALYIQKFNFFVYANTLKETSTWYYSKIQYNYLYKELNILKLLFNVDIYITNIVLGNKYIKNYFLEHEKYMIIAIKNVYILSLYEDYL